MLSNRLALWLYFPDGLWCFLSLCGCLKAMPYPQATTHRRTHKHVCAHGSRNCWGSANMEHIHQRKALRAVTMEISVSETPSAEVCPQNRLRLVWVGVCVCARHSGWVYGGLWELEDGEASHSQSERQAKLHCLEKHQCPHVTFGFQEDKCASRHKHIHRWLSKGYTDLQRLQKVVDTRLKRRCSGSEMEKEC